VGTEKEINKDIKLTADKIYSSSEQETVSSNKVAVHRELSGEWRASGSYQRGKVQSHDGQMSRRDAVGLGLGFESKDKESGDTKTKMSSKLEVRLDRGNSDKHQYLVQNKLESKLMKELTVSLNTEVSKTNNTTENTSDAEYKRLSLGTAWRPGDNDRLNMLSRYTYLEEKSPLSQSDVDNIEEEKAHVFAAEAILDVTEKWQVSQKLGYRMLSEKVSGFQELTDTQTWLIANRINYRITENWKVGAEYRLLRQLEAEDLRQGFLVEAVRKFGPAELGIGYNFTDFTDDLTHLNYSAHGPYIRLTGVLDERVLGRGGEREQTKEDVKTWEYLYKELGMLHSETIDLKNSEAYPVAEEKLRQLEETQKLMKKCVTGLKRNLYRLKKEWKKKTKKPEVAYDQKLQKMEGKDRKFSQVESVGTLSQEKAMGRLQRLAQEGEVLYNEAMDLDAEGEYILAREKFQEALQKAEEVLKGYEEFSP